MKSHWMLPGLLLAAQLLLGQGSTMTLRFQMEYQGGPLELDQAYRLPDGGAVTIENLRFYVSDVAFFHEGRELAKDGPQHWLVDAADAASLSRSWAMKNSLVCDNLRFQLGIDSITNVSGALGGDLDPTRGMYWTWQSGYINFKLEGRSPACPARNHFFQFHLGGYLAPFSALQSVALAVPPDGKDLVVVLSVDEILQGIDLRTQYEVMSPNAQAVALAGLVSKAFKLGSDGR